MARTVTVGRIRAASAMAAAVLLAGASLLATGGTSGAVPVPASGSAFGVSAGGVIDIAPTPTAPPDETVAMIAQPPLLTTGILTATANLNDATGDFTSTATVADVSALDGLVTAMAVQSTCTASGTELTGDSTLADVDIALLPVNVPLNPPPNTVLTIPAVATVFLNEQVLAAFRLVRGLNGS